MAVVLGLDVGVGDERLVASQGQQGAGTRTASAGGEHTYTCEGSGIKWL